MRALPSRGAIGLSTATLRRCFSVLFLVSPVTENFWADSACIDGASRHSCPLMGVDEHLVRLSPSLHRVYSRWGKLPSDIHPCFRSNSTADLMAVCARRCFIVRRPLTWLFSACFCNILFLCHFYSCTEHCRTASFCIKLYY